MSPVKWAKAWRTGTPTITKMYKQRQKSMRIQQNLILLILLEKSLFSNLSIHSHTRSACMAGTPKYYWKVTDTWVSSKTSQKWLNSVTDQMLVRYHKPDPSASYRSFRSTVHHRQTPGYDCKIPEIIALIKGTYEQGVKSQNLLINWISTMYMINQRSVKKTNFSIKIYHKIKYIACLFEY